jgi:hypothetical protein
MTERDQWTEVLRCPKCQATGTVVLSQASPNSRAFHDLSDQNVRIELAPRGFSAVTTDHGPVFYCAKCGVVAHHG